MRVARGHPEWSPQGQRRRGSWRSAPGIPWQEISLSRPCPCASHLNIDRGVILTECNVQTSMHSILARQFVTKAGSASHQCLDIIQMLEIVPCCPSANKTNQAEALPELPAEFS